MDQPQNQVLDSRLTSNGALVNWEWLFKTQLAHINLVRTQSRVKKDYSNAHNFELNSQARAKSLKHLGPRL